MTLLHRPRHLMLCGMACGVLLAASPPAAAAEAQRSLQTLFQTANAAAYRGDYATAIEHYQNLVDAGIEDADLSFNLALVLLVDGQLGRARLALERARRQRPGDAGVEQALLKLKQRLAGPSAVAPSNATMPDTATTLLRSEPSPLADPFVDLPADLFAWLLLLGVSLLCALMPLRWLLPAGARRQLTTAVAIASGLAALFGVLGLSVQRQWWMAGQPAVVLQQSALRSGPDRRAPQRAVVTEGSVVQQLQRLGDSVQVQTNPVASRQPPRQGWLRAADLSLVDEGRQRLW